MSGAVYSLTRSQLSLIMATTAQIRRLSMNKKRTVFFVSDRTGITAEALGRRGLLSTPAASLLIPHLGAAGGCILTASHNPGGPKGDFGIKLNMANGGQASETSTNTIYQRSLAIARYFKLDTKTKIDIDKIGTQQLGDMRIEIVDPVKHYVDVMERLFDFERIRELLIDALFHMRFDALHAVTGPYAIEIFERRLGAPSGTVMHGVPSEDFAGCHPDPNPQDAEGFIKLFTGDNSPVFGAASDGDGDRNMILGRGLMVSPGDSLAVLTANARLVPGYAAGLVGVARSLPTSHAVDRVAQKLGITCYETPTGWRYFFDEIIFTLKEIPAKLAPMLHQYLAYRFRTYSDKI